MIKIAIADDHQMFRDGIIAILQLEKDCEVVGEAGNAQEVFETLDKVQADILLLDIALGKNNGIEMTKTLRVRYPSMKVIMISMHSESSYVIKSLEVGAAGYLLKDAGKVEMLNAIRAVISGGTYFGKQVSQILMSHFSTSSKPIGRQEEVMLTRREIEVLKLLATEHSNHEVADKLFISVRTVDTHRRNLLEKLKLKNNAGLVRYAINQGLID
ncbi:MAG: response regulator transcription factor [Saprospiraceae bacterium]|nr:response regulator transcription factor [Saprospiraceae bacterium]